MEPTTGHTLEWCNQSFRAFENSLNGDAQTPFHQVRKAAYARFTELGFPTTKQEEWKYTNLNSLSKTAFHLPKKGKDSNISRETLERIAPLNFQGPALVFVNGKYCAEHSRTDKLPPGVCIGSLEEALLQKSTGVTDQSAWGAHLSKLASYTDRAFVALNTAFITDGAFLLFKRGVCAKQPIQVIFLTTGEEEIITHPRVLVIAEENSQACVIETYAGLNENTYLTNAVSEISLGENAVVEHYKLQLESSKSFHISNIGAVQKRTSRLSTYSFSFGGSLVRNEVAPSLKGEGCENRMFGLSVLNSSQHVDNHTVINHAEPHCESNEWYKGIYADDSRGVFDGTIIVQPDAQKTNAIQSNQSLLLSNQAAVNSKPQLKIWANDVKCTHGATVGQLDEDALFYLRSRGISQEQARAMLIQAFAGDITKEIKHEELKTFVSAHVQEKLMLSLSS